MPHEVLLRVQHPRLGALVREWLADARLALPRPVTLTIDVGPLPLAAADDREIFRQGPVNIRSGPPIHTVTLEWEPRLGRALLAPGSTHAHVVVTEAAIDRENEMLRSFLLDTVILLLRRVGLHHVHGAALIDPLGRGWLLAGSSGAGKSTTTALLAMHGWTVGTDDIAFLMAGNTKDAVHVAAWHERLALHPSMAATIGVGGGTSLSARHKLGWYPEELGAPWTAQLAPAFLLFPGTEHPAMSSVTPIKARDAVTRLMKWSPWVALEADLADEHLGILSRLARQARTYDLTLGHDLFANPDRLLELVA